MLVRSRLVFDARSSGALAGARRSRGTAAAASRQVTGDGMSDDLIANQPKIKAQIVITVYDASGEVGQFNLQTSGDFNEVIARFMMAKASSMLEDHWRQVATPRVIPRQTLNGMPEALKRHFR